MTHPYFAKAARQSLGRTPQQQCKRPMLDPPANPDGKHQASIGAEARPDRIVILFVRIAKYKRFNSIIQGPKKRAASRHQTTTAAQPTRTCTGARPRMQTAHARQGLRLSLSEPLTCLFGNASSMHISLMDAHASSKYVAASCHVAIPMYSKMWHWACAYPLHYVMPGPKPLVDGMVIY